MTNEMLVELIQQGNNDELVPLLWGKTCNLIYLKLKQYWVLYQDTFRRYGYELSDLRQEGYNVLIFAIKQYTGAKQYKFSTYFNYAIQNTVRNILGSKADTLNQAKTVSLEQPLTESEDGNELTVADIVPDEQAEQEYDRINDLDKYKLLHEAVDSLPENERRIIQLRYFQGMTQRQISEKLDLPAKDVRTMENRALRLLRTGRTGKQLNDVYGDEYKSHRVPLVDNGYLMHLACFAFPEK